LAKNGDEFLNKYDYILKYDEIPTGKNCGDSLSEIKENNNYEKQVLLNIESKNDSELNFRGNVPNINDDWEKISKYAIEIDFYDYWGSKDKFFEVVEKIKNDYDYFDSIPKSPVKLRTFLFYLQKRIRFNNKGQIPNDQEWKVINKILKKLSSKDV
jgi:tRNA G10  N-methylase Trm11